MSLHNDAFSGSATVAADDLPGWLWDECERIRGLGVDAEADGDAGGLVVDLCAVGRLVRIEPATPAGVRSSVAGELRDLAAEIDPPDHLPTGDEVDRRAAEYGRALALIDSQGEPGYPARIREAQAIFARLGYERKAVKP